MDDLESNTVIENPPAVISPNNKISTRPPNIKERLNLHVKRRLQETVPDLPQQHDIQTSSIPTNHPHNRQPPLNTTTTTGSHRRNIAVHHGRGGKRSKNKHISNANAPLNSSAGDDECSRDGGNSSSCNDTHHHKEKDTGPDLLTMILNEKKLSLIRSPEITSFLESIVGTLRK